MKKPTHKDGIIYKSMKKHRRSLAFNFTLTAVILCVYFFMFKPYILNVLCGSYKLDANLFAKDAEMISISKDTVLSGNDSIAIKNYALNGSSYWQGENYEFDTEILNVKETGITYTTKNTSETYKAADGEGILSAVLYMADINGVKTLVLSYPHEKIADGKTVTGIFTEIPPVVKADLSALGEYNNISVFKYMLDTRGIEMESERFDIMLTAILLILALYLGIKLVIYYINPCLTPTYRELTKYGDADTIAADVEKQLKEAGVFKINKKTPAYTEDWIVSQDSFKLKITKNHVKPQDNSRYGSRF